MTSFVAISLASALNRLKARGEALVARAEVVHSGDTLTLCESRVYSVAGDRERLCAVALVTLWPLAVAKTNAGETDRTTVEEPAPVP